MPSQLFFERVGERDLGSGRRDDGRLDQARVVAEVQAEPRAQRLMLFDGGGDAVAGVSFVAEHRLVDVVRQLAHW